MFLVFMISLSIIFYFICMEFDNSSPPEKPLCGECPECDAAVETGWLVCPECQTVLREGCPECGKVHDIWVRYCPWCRNMNKTVKS